MFRAMKEKKKARMRDGGDRNLKTVYFYDGWYAVRNASVVHWCGDSSYIHNGGNLNNVPSDDIFNLGSKDIIDMSSLVKHVIEHCHEN